MAPSTDSKYEKAIFDIANKSMSTEDLDEFINYTLDVLGKLTRVSRVYIFENVKDDKFSNTHEWYKSKEHSFKEGFQNMSSSDYQMSLEILESNNVISASSLDEIPKELAKLLKERGVKSLLVVPIFLRARFYGFLGFTEQEIERKWREADIYLLRTVAHMLGAAISRHQGVRKRHSLEVEVGSIKNIFRHVIDSAIVCIVLVDLDGNIVFWNRATEECTGIKSKKAVGKKMIDIDCKFNQNNMKNLFEHVKKTGKTQNITTELKYHGANRIISFSIGLIKDDAGKQLGITYLGTDVTELYPVTEKILKGRSYLLSTDRTDFVTDLFKRVATDDSLVISRSRIEDLQVRFQNRKFEHIWLDVTEINQSFLKKIEERIKDFSGVIFFERIDYLIATFGFDVFMRFIYQLNSIILKSDSIMLIHMNPQLLDDRQKAFLEAELIALRPNRKGSSAINRELLDIMKYIQISSANGTFVSMSDISINFSITRPTTSARVRKLLEIKYVATEKVGRKRVILLTVEGRHFLENID